MVRSDNHAKGARAHPTARAGNETAVGFSLALLLMAICLAAGCASPESAAPPTQRRPRFVRTQSGNQVTLQWDSQPGQTYTVLYATELKRRGTAWQPVPGYETYLAHDRTTRLIFTDPAPGSKANYRILTVGR